MGNPNALAIGPGILLINPTLGASEPVDLSGGAGGWPAGWAQLGYTDSGSVFGIETTFEDVTVAEELDPVQILATARAITVSFSLAEITATNLKRIFNGGTITAGSGCVIYDPPALGAEVYVMLGWESTAVDERWIFRKSIQTAKVEISRQKAPNKALLPAEFRCVVPAGGLKPYRIIEASPARA